MTGRIAHTCNSATIGLGIHSAANNRAAAMFWTVVKVADKSNRMHASTTRNKAPRHVLPIKIWQHDTMGESLPANGNLQTLPATRPRTRRT